MNIFAFLAEQCYLAAWDLYKIKLNLNQPHPVVTPQKRQETNV